MNDIESRIRTMMARRGDAQGSASAKPAGCNSGCGSKRAGEGIPMSLSPGQRLAGRAPSSSKGVTLPRDSGPIGRYTTLRMEGHV